MCSSGRSFGKPFNATGSSRTFNPLSEVTVSGSTDSYRLAMAKTVDPLWPYRAVDEESGFNAIYGYMWGRHANQD